LKLSAVMLGEFVDPQGRVYSASSPWVQRIGRRFEVRAPDGSLLREAAIPSDQTTAQILPWMGGDDAGVWYSMADQMGNIYLVDAVSRTTIGKETIFLTEHLRVNSDLSVVKLDPQGRLVTAVRIPSRPFSNSHSVFVDPKGDIYYFEFGAESVSVNMIPGDSLVAAAAKTPSKIVAIREPLPPEKRTVALRRGLDRKGWQFAWDAASRRAVAANEGVRLEVTIGSNEARMNGKVIPLSQPAYIASGRTYVPCSLVTEVARMRRTGG